LAGFNTYSGCYLKYFNSLKIVKSLYVIDNVKSE
jgi:hypothetical protein